MDDAAGSGGRKPSKKELAKLERQRKRQEAAAAAASAAAAAAVEAPPDDDPKNYGHMPFSTVLSGKKWISVKKLSENLVEKGVAVVFRGFLKTIRHLGKKIAFIMVRDQGFVVQCVLATTEGVSVDMIRFATTLKRESYIEIEGVVSMPRSPIKGGSIQQVEIQVRKLYCISESTAELPFQVEEAILSPDEEVTPIKNRVSVNQDTRLTNRVLDLRIPSNYAIFRLESEVTNIFTQFLLSEDFLNIHTPKILHGEAEGGANVFKLKYFDHEACLAQSPALHKQMAISAGLGRVFEIGAKYRAENSSTHRHLCEFIGLDVEMEIKEHYSEVMDIVNRLFVKMFDTLHENCAKELEVINSQYPCKKLKYLQEAPRLTFEEGVQMLKEAGLEVDPSKDLNTEAERKLGELVLEKYATDFYILHRYPLAFRPFFYMPCHDNRKYSNSFDVFIRGEEIISGAQRIHVPELLEQRVQECGISRESMSLEAYIDSFRYGTPPHGGFGAGLERVVMLICGLDNIRKASLFPRDPRRLVP